MITKILEKLKPIYDFCTAYLCWRYFIVNCSFGKLRKLCTIMQNKVKTFKLTRLLKILKNSTKTSLSDYQIYS